MLHLKLPAMLSMHPNVLISERQPPIIPQKKWPSLIALVGQMYLASLVKHQNPQPPLNNLVTPIQPADLLF